jgi:cobalamin-dependent methionine synthase I
VLVISPLDSKRELAALRISASLVRWIRNWEGKGKDSTSASTFLVGLQLVTVGSKVAQEAGRLAREGKIHDQFLLHGLAAELTEALAQYAQDQLQKQAGWSEAKRYSPGYPAWPELSEQKKVFKLLKPGRIGVRLTRGFQMVPEYSTSAIIIRRG